MIFIFFIKIEIYKSLKTKLGSNDQDEDFTGFENIGAQKDKIQLNENNNNLEKPKKKQCCN